MGFNYIPVYGHEDEDKVSEDCWQFSVRFWVSGDACMTDIKIQQTKPQDF